MKKHLFLDGEIGCGKSTLLRKALGEALDLMGASAYSDGPNEAGASR